MCFRRKTIKYGNPPEFIKREALIKFNETAKITSVSIKNYNKNKITPSYLIRIIIYNETLFFLFFRTKDRFFFIFIKNQNLNIYNKNFFNKVI